MKVVVFERYVEPVAEEFDIPLSGPAGEFEVFGKMFGVRKPACLDLGMKPYKPLILQPVGHRYSQIQNCQDYSIF
jgi:hypothetical protein